MFKHCLKFEGSNLLMETVGYFCLLLAFYLQGILKLHFLSSQTFISLAVNHPDIIFDLSFKQWPCSLTLYK